MPCKFPYIPKPGLVALDLMFWVLTSAVVFVWRLVVPIPRLEKYGYFMIAVIMLWQLMSYVFGRYRPLSESKYSRSISDLLLVGILTGGGALVLIVLLPLNISLVVIMMVVLIQVLCLSLFYGLYFGIKYSAYVEEIFVPTEQRERKKVLNHSYRLSEEEVRQIEFSIANIAGTEVLEMLKTNLDLGTSNTRVMATHEIFNFETAPAFRFDHIVNMVRLNDIRGINRMLCVINAKLPDDGVFVCCFKPKDVMKRYILGKYHSGLNYLIYTFYFIKRRILPKLFVTRRLYFDMTKGKNRVLTETEVLGRLYYCGFKVINTITIGDYEYVFSQRSAMPEPQMTRKYGPFIKLRRVGKNGKRFNVYKLRTMHPYSEYLQQYIFDKNHLDEGGKMKDDPRITTIGKYMRKYWIDELPMLFNLVKGEMKLVGVRPLSNQYFGLYCDELKQLRVKYKPGLLPPFYKDMPKTLEEIQQSELNYLYSCRDKGVCRTDWNYFWSIMNNILFKKARSK